MDAQFLLTLGEYADAELAGLDAHAVRSRTPDHNKLHWTDRAIST